MFHCTSLRLPPEAAIKRESTRPVEFRQPGFDKAFDASTLFYDLILSSNKHGNNLIFIGPPFLNLLPSFYGGRIGGRPLASITSNYYLRYLCSDVWVPNWDGEAVDLEFDFGSYRLTPQGAANHLYQGRRVLYTLSRDNEVSWIVDWVQFHARNHGANAVLLYDNASTKYSGEDLEGSLREAFPSLEINVVHWPYKYGPQGIKGWWDSSFCQAAAFHDARFRFLDSASSVLNCDIDELVVSEKGESIFDITEKSRNGCTLFGCKRISNATFGTQLLLNSLSDLRHSRFRYLPRAQPPQPDPPKWCVVPRRCKVEEYWGNHWLIFGGTEPQSRNLSWGRMLSSHSDSFSYRHFLSISTSWKYPRVGTVVFDPKLHQFDEKLDQALVHAGIGRPEAKPPRSFLEIVRQTTRYDRIKHLGTSWKRRLRNVARRLRWLASQLNP
jgi:hypothetical protein